MNLKRWSDRLRKVQSDELLYRLHEAGISLNDRILGPRISFPEKIQSVPLPKWPFPLRLEGSVSDLHATADAILNGEWRLLNQTWDGKTPWGWDAIHQWSWPMDGSPIGMVGRGPSGIDPKFAWEPLRLDGVLILALAGHTGHSKAYELGLLLWRNLYTRHQPFKGFLYTSGIECSFRLMKSLILNVVFESEYTSEDQFRIWRLLWGHQQWLRRYPSLFSSGNNHRIAELAGLAVIEALSPELPRAAPQKVAYELLQHIRTLMHEDGVYVEQSLYYQGTIMEWLLLVKKVVSSQNIYFPADSILEYLTVHMLSMLGPEGTAPMIGDVDDSYILPRTGQSTYLSSVAQSVAADLDVSVPFQPTRDLRSELLGLRLPEYQPTMPLQKSFPDGGISQLLHEDVRLIIDHGPLGYDRMAAHAHADTLSLWLYKSGRPIWVDFGSYAYSAAPKWREWSRSTAAHNTLEINGQSSSTTLGAFAWRDRAQGFLLERGHRVITVAHDGYEHRFGIRHTRKVSLEQDGILIVDTVDGSGEHHVRLSFLLGSGLRLNSSEDGVLCEETSLPIAFFEMSNVGLVFNGYHGDDLQEGWQATGYMRKRPATRLTWSGTVTLPTTIELFWRWA